MRDEVQPNVLVVDDDAVLRLAVVTLLESGRLRILEAGSAAEALQQSVLWSRIDLAIVDLQLGDEDGVAVAERISDDHPGSLIVCMSGSTPTADQRRRMERFQFLPRDDSLFERLSALTPRGSRREHA
jgi:CheY-like chemotaxis protein